MIGADLMVLLFGLGLIALALPTGRVAMQSARAVQRGRTILFGVGTVLMLLAGLYCVALGLLRLFHS